MSPRRRQTKTRISRRKETSENTSPQFAAPPVIQPKIQRKTERELPEWKPGGSGKSSPLRRLQPSAALQAKLEIGQPKDPYEQQADQVAHNVVQALHSPTAETVDTQLTGQGKTAPTIQLDGDTDSSANWTEYTVKNTAHLRDGTLKNEGRELRPGQKVKISNNSIDHRKDRAGNIWFKVADSQQYIRSTHLHIYTDPGTTSSSWFSKHPARTQYPNETEIIDQLVNNAENRDKNKGFLREEEVSAISTLSQDEEGKSFLLQKGCLTNDKLDKVAREKKTTLDWHRTEKHRGLENLPLANGDHVLSHIHRLQIATYQRDLGRSNPEYQQTLGYLRYEAQTAKTQDNVKQDIYGKDTQMWEQTLASIPENALSQLGPERARQLREQTESAQNILRRIFIVLHSGLKYRDDTADKIFKNDWPETVAVALSHGGRVMVKLPAISQGQDRNEFINWLLGNTSGEQDSKGSKKPNQVSGTNIANTDYGKAQVDTRNFSTHDIEIGTTETFKELNPRGNNSKGQSEEHYGMDIPLGGLGREDLAGEVTLPDGSHGHMYIFYEPPTLNKPGGLLIGAETSRMGRTDVYGQYHDVKGNSAEFSPTGTSKEARIGAKIGGRIVDFTKGSYTEVTDKNNKVQQQKVQGGHTEVRDPNWLQQLKDAEQNIYNGQITAAELVGRTTPELKAKLLVENINTPVSNDAQQHSTVQRQTKESNLLLRLKPTGRQSTLGGGKAPTQLESSINRAKSSGKSLDPSLQRSMGTAMGVDFSGVKVHTDARASQLSESIQAKAFTTGQNIFFKQGEYQPQNRGGQESIAHELTHVVQQSKVAPSPGRGGNVVRKKPDTTKDGNPRIQRLGEKQKMTSKNQQSRSDTQMGVNFGGRATTGQAQSNLGDEIVDYETAKESWVDLRDQSLAQDLEEGEVNYEQAQGDVNTIGSNAEDLRNLIVTGEVPLTQHAVTEDQDDPNSIQKMDDADERQFQVVEKAETVTAKIRNYLNSLKESTWGQKVLESSETYKKIKAWKKRRKQMNVLKKNSGTEADPDLQKAMEYGYAKVRRSTWANFGNMVIEVSSLILNIVTLFSGGIASTINAGFKFVVEIGKAIISLVDKAKGLWKWLNGTRGQARKEAAEQFVNQAKNGNQNSLDTILAFKPFKGIKDPTNPSKTIHQTLNETSNVDRKREKLQSLLAHDQTARSIGDNLKHQLTSKAI